MNESKKNIEINSILKAILKREYPSYISKNFSSQIMDKIYKTSFRNNIYSHTLRIASAVTFAVATLFLMESFFVDKVKYSKEIFSSIFKRLKDFNTEPKLPIP